MPHAATEQCGFPLGPGECLRRAGHDRHEALRTKHYLNWVRHRTERGLEPVTDLFHLSRYVRPRDHDRRCTRRGLYRFPESTGRDHGRESLRIRGVDQQKIYITIEAQVLKSIVEYQTIDRKSIQDPVTEFITI